MRKYLKFNAEIYLPVWTFEYLIVIISDLVINQLQKSETVTDVEFEKTLSEVMSKVKDIAFNAKKNSQASATADE